MGAMLELWDATINSMDLENVLSQLPGTKVLMNISLLQVKCISDSFAVQVLQAQPVPLDLCGKNKGSKVAYTNTMHVQRECLREPGKRP